MHACGDLSYSIYDYYTVILFSQIAKIKLRGHNNIACIFTFVKYSRIVVTAILLSIMGY